MRVDNRDGLPVGDTEDPVLVVSPREGVPPLIDTPEALSTAARALAGGTTPVALDVERAQGFRWGHSPYLIQIRREGVGTFLVDTHALPDLSALSPALTATWLLHDAEQDIHNLREVGLDTTDLFDTMVAARLLGFDRFSLAALCERLLGLAIVKDHQASDWSVRPLPTDWLRYAALDVEFLTELHRHLATALHDAGRWQWAQEEFARVLAEPAPAPKPDKWRSVKGIGRLRTRRELATLKALWETRDRLAERIDLAPGRLVRNSALLTAAQRPPRNRRALLAISDFRSPNARQFTDEWLRTLGAVALLHEDDLPPKRVPLPPGAIPDLRHWQRQDPEAWARLEAVRTAVASIADGLGMEPEVVLEPRVQRFLCWAPLDAGKPVSDAVRTRLEESRARRWQIDLTADALTRALA